jgi:deoxyinosine 3'endonuclease (endonuclease V)
VLKARKTGIFVYYFREQQGIVSSIITDIDEIEQPIKYVAGLDISFVKTNDKAVASMVIFDYETLNIVAKISVNCNMKIPYIASYLAFREAPVFMKLIDIQKEHCPHLTPQVILMDGNGVWHPRRAGIASHFGVLSGIPCFGVSKNVLYADGITRDRIEELLTEKAPKKDQYTEVIGDSGNVLGLAYNVTGFVKNAVYISVGHKITLPTACNIFKSVTKYRNCEPIRQADLLSREMVAKLS